jgi:hypothetical protein
MKMGIMLVSIYVMSITVSRPRGKVPGGLQALCAETEVKRDRRAHDRRSLFQVRYAYRGWSDERQSMYERFR